jgi:hypothetical protein
MMVALHRDIICHPNGGGRRHAMGQPTALFKADGVGDGFQRNMTVNVDRFVERGGHRSAPVSAAAMAPGMFWNIRIPMRSFT